MEIRSQFFRIQTFGLTSRGKKPTVRRVVGEGLRLTKANCKHVENPAFPNVLYGRWLDILPKSLAASKKAFEKKFKRKLRDDAQIFAGMVASYPARVQKLLDDPFELQSYLGWVDLVLADAQQMEKDHPGARLAGVVEHLDEGWPHLHLWFVAREHEGQFDLGLLHPGRVADATHKGKDRIPAVKLAMSKWQDERFLRVSAKCGHARRSASPKPRLTYKAWKKQKELERKLAEKRDEKRKMEEQIEQLQCNLRNAQNRPGPGF